MGPAELALAGDLGLVEIDACAGLRRLDAGHAIEAGEPRHRDADKTAVENIGAADRLAVGAHHAVRLPVADHRRRIGRKQVRIARDAVVVGAAAERVGMEGEVALAGVELHRAIEPVVDALSAPLTSPAKPRSGMKVGMRLLSTLTTPPIACEPKRNVAGPRITSICFAANGSIGTPWSSLRSDTSLTPSPFSADAIVVEAAHHRAARGARREAGRRDAGLRLQHFAECAAGAALDLSAGHHRHGGELVGDDRQRPLQRAWHRNRVSRSGRALDRARGVDRDLG